MALGVTVDFTANLGNITGQIDTINNRLSGFQRNAETISSRVSKAFGLIGVGVSIAGMTAFVKSGIDAADTLNDMSIKTGIAVEKLSGFQLVTKQSGTDMEAFIASANKLSVNIGKDADSFAKLGISAKDPAEAFMQLADVMAGIADPQQRAALGAKALGKSWSEMAPLLLQGGAALRQGVAEGAALNGTTTEMAQNADQFNDRLEIMNRYLGNVAANVAGPVIEGFNQLAAKLTDATDKGITFNNVMRGIGDFAFDTQSFKGMAGDLQRVNEQIDVQEKKLKAIKNNGAIGGLIDGLAGTDVTLEQNKLDSLYKQQEDYYNKLKDLKTQPANLVKVPDQKTVADFIGGGAGSGDAALKDKAASIAQLTNRYNDLLSSLQKEVSLRGDNTEAGKMEWEVINGALQNLNEGQKLKLLNLAAEKDAIELNTKAYEDYDQIIADGLDLAKKQRADSEATQSRLTQKFDAPRLDLNAGITDVADAKNLGIINEAQAKAAYDKLGKAYNDSFIDPAKLATDTLSEYGIQAARNMESAFAQFLFDPFAKGSASMLDSFVNVLKQMAAQAASAEIMKGLFGATGVKDGGGLLGSAFTGLAGLFHEGGIVGQTGSTISVNPSVFTGAHRYHGGGVAGLKPDEVPAILQKGELVVSRKQLAGTQSRSGDITVNTQVSVSGNSSDNAMTGLGNLINAKIKEVLVTEKRPGGLLAS